MTMDYMHATLILHESGREINETNLKAVLEAAGAEVIESRVKALVAALEGVDIEAIAPSPELELELELETTDGEPADPTPDGEGMATPTEGADEEPVDDTPGSGDEGAAVETGQGPDVDEPVETPTTDVEAERSARGAGDAESSGSTVAGGEGNPKAKDTNAVSGSDLDDAAGGGAWDGEEYPETHREEDRPLPESRGDGDNTSERAGTTDGGVR